jgi:signal transduction histidine kinase/CheY-like chemotaxis protein
MMEQDANHHSNNKYIAWKKLFLLIAVFLFAILAVLPFSKVLASGESVPPAPKQHILFINSYSRDFSTVPVVISAVEEKVKDIASTQYIFMNTKNRDLKFAYEQTERELIYLQDKAKFDLIITGDDDALDFVRKYRDKYFAGIPVVFEDVNSEAKVKETVAQDPLICGLVEKMPVRKTVQLATDLYPKARHIVIVSDRSISGQGTDQQFLDLQPDFPKIKFEILNTTLYKTEDLRKKLGTYGEDTILIFGVFAKDGSGHIYPINEGSSFLSSSAKIPVFKADEAGLGDGMLGGCVLSYESIGVKTGDMARKILEKQATPKVLGYQEGDFQYKFDIKAMKRFQLTKATLSRYVTDPVYVNDTPSFYELHSSVLLGAAFILLIFTILFLINDRRRNRESNEKIAASRAEARIAELANQAKTDFLSHMSHDIRTPLNAIIGLSRLAKDDINNPDKVKDDLDNIFHSGEILLGLLNDVLDVSRIEKGKMVLNNEPYSMDNFIVSLHTMFDNVCAHKGINFAITGNAAGHTLLIDKVRFNQVMSNLINNATKFTPAGGTISVNLCCDEPGPDGLVPCIFSVSDDGCGMSPEFQKKMFEPFTQEASSLSTNTSGSGLGLAIVHSIVKLVGGTFEVNSAPQKGSTFTLRFKVKSAASPAAVAADNSQPANPNTDEDYGLNGLRVLVVEDQQLNAMIAQRLLSKHGILVDIAENGKIAVDKFVASKRGFYAAILMDIRMPLMDGHTATQQIRSLLRDDAKTIPIIAMTAEAFDGEVNASLRQGMNAHITKPITPSVLFTTLAKFCAPQHKG